MARWNDLPKKSLGRLVWGRSLLSPNAHEKKIERSAVTLAAYAAALKDRFIPSLPRPVPLDTSRPRLARPAPPESGSFRPPRYFFRGAFETNRKKNPEPIRYLLTESLENPIARPVPQNSSLIRSLCKGKGVLSQNREGLLYLNVDDHFISSMIPYLKRQGLVQPPTLVGAHIPVIPKREADFQYLSSIREIGTEYSFEIEGLYSIQPDTWPDVKEVWFFKVRSPELEALRRRYFLIERPLGHSFHIAVAIQPRNNSIKEPPPTPYLRINPGCLAA